MTWLAILSLAGAACVLAVFALRLARAGWTMFLAALMFGLAGYALQGSPDLPASPRTAMEHSGTDNFAAIAARRAFFGPESAPARFVTVADGFSRKGQFTDAAQILQIATQENPVDTEAWVALGNALVEHGEGAFSPAAKLAYSRAQEIAPGHPAASYFEGVALLRNGEFAQTRAIWSELLDNAPDDAPWRGALELQLHRLDAVMEAMTKR